MGGDLPQYQAAACAVKRQFPQKHYPDVAPHWSQIQQIACATREGKNAD